MTQQDIIDQLGLLSSGDSINIVVYSIKPDAILNLLKKLKPANKSILIRANSSARDTIYKVLQFLPETQVFTEFDSLFDGSLRCMPFFFHLVIKPDSLEGFVGCHDMTQEILSPNNGFPVVLSTFTIEEFIEHLASSDLEITEIQ